MDTTISKPLSFINKTKCFNANRFNKTIPDICITSFFINSYNIITAIIDTFIRNISSTTILNKFILGTS